jgi:hypothetical protein
VKDTIFVTGCVRDSHKQTMANALVLTNGIDYSGPAGVYTAADGTFTVAMRRNGRATLVVFDVDLQTFEFIAVSNLVNVGPSAVDFTLPNCLVRTAGPLTITTSALAGGNVGAAYNQTLAATGGIPAYTWTLDVSSNPLPDGLFLNPSGVIFGTPTTAGTTTITVKVTDSAGGTITKQLSLTISPPGVLPLTITSLSPLPAGTVGTAYSIPLAASGGTPSLSWSIVSGALPDGVMINSTTGQLTGIPTTQGTSTFTIRVQDSGNPQLSDQKAFSLTINPISGSNGGGTLTVANAPAIVGGTFVANARGIGTIFSGFNNNAGLTWGEGTLAVPGSHVEAVTINFNYATGQTTAILFQVSDPAGQTAPNWGCGLGLSSLCSLALVGSIQINGTAGTVTFVDTVLPSLASDPPITLNGTLNFVPFY